MPEIITYTLEDALLPVLGGEPHDQLYPLVWVPLAVAVPLAYVPPAKRVTEVGDDTPLKLQLVDRQLKLGEDDPLTLTDCELL